MTVILAGAAPITTTATKVPPYAPPTGLDAALALAVIVLIALAVWAYTRHALRKGDDR